jgi:alkylresorcinol/alkylpyrone synthase
MSHTITPPRSLASATGAIADQRPPVMPVVLSDFKRVSMTPLVGQDELKEIQVHFMTIAQCAKYGITDESEKREMHAKIADRMKRYGVSSDHITKRQVSVLTSWFVKPHDDATGPAFPSSYGDLRTPTGEALDARMDLFEETASAAFEKAYEGEITPPDDIVHVSCSGYVSPSPVQVFLSGRGWFNTGVTHSYHMGCYGAFPAIRTAVGLVGSSFSSLPKSKKRVDLFHTEFLSLHFDLLAEAPDNFVTSTLFADGFIKYSAYPQSEFGSSKRGLKVLAIEEQILPDSLPEMTLRPGPFQFDMSLSKRVPVLIRNTIDQFVHSLCLQAGIDFEAEKGKMVFAIHPGGPAIINHVRNRLGIEESQIELSRKVLYENGNMASATAPHIWQHIVESDDIPAGTKVLSMAFGPGLTVIGAIFERV